MTVHWTDSIFQLHHNCHRKKNLGAAHKYLFLQSVDSTQLLDCLLPEKDVPLKGKNLT